jgi:branched-chain amino acid transport system substrate-binding protein
MKKLTFVFLLLVSALLFVLPIAAQDEAAEIAIGVVLPFTGPLGSYGQEFARGAELAVEQMNERLETAGIETRFVIASADTTGSPDGAARAVETVVQTTGAQIIIGPLTTAEVLGAKQFADTEGIVIVAPVSASNAAAIPDDNIFRVMYPPDRFSARAFVEIAAARGYQNVAILYVDEPYGNSLSQQFSDGFTEMTGGSVAAIKYTPNPTDLSSEATALSAEVANMGESTAVLCICYLEDAKKLLQVAQVDPILSSVPWMGIENLGTPAFLEDEAYADFLRSVDFTVVSMARTNTPLTQGFVDAFVEKFGNRPGPFTNMVFDATNIAMNTALVAGNDGAAIESMLPFVSSHYIGTSVQGYLDANGDQAIAYYGIYTPAADAAEFVQIGSFDALQNILELTSAE